MDQSKKTMRHFYCRDVLWETFEQMANDFDCSIDYLINEAMRYYARSKNYQSAQATGGEFRGSTGPNAQPAGLAPPAAPSQGFPQAPGPAPTAPGNSGNMRRAAPPPPPPAAALRPPTSSTTNPGGVQALQSPTPQGGMPATPRRPAPPAPRSTPVEPMPAAAGNPTLFLIFNNQKIPIEKDQFIIGRGSKTSDLAIKDGNISRKHAAVIRRNGTYYIKDLGSTNGIDYKGTRIDNKRIDEGDIFHLCDYELTFTYRT
jgi:hypothetical protein